jgi:hypothetical protein
LIHVRVDVEVVSPNQSAYEHWGTRRRRTRDQREATADALQSATRGVRPPLPCTVRLCRVGPGRLDGDRLQGSLAAVRDAAAGWLLGGNGSYKDSDPRIRWEYTQVRVRVPSYATVLITPATQPEAQP